jgi:glycosidase
MTGTKPDERIRTPMQWAPSPADGFTTVIPWEPVQTDATSRTVGSQTADASSLLSTYRQLIRLRLDHASLRTGSTTLIDAGTAPLLGYVRAAGTETLLVVHNFAAAQQPIAIRVPSLPVGTYGAVDLLVGGNVLPCTVDDTGTLRGLDLMIAPFGTLVLDVSRA